MAYALLLAGDLDKNGELGSKTIKRLNSFLNLQYQDTVVLTGGFIPNYPIQQISLAELMNNYLSEHHFTNVIVEPTDGSLGTYNELRTFFSLSSVEQADKLFVFTTRYHVPRTKLLVRKHFGNDIYKKVNFVALNADKPSLKEILLLEPIKYFCLLIPLLWQLKLTHLSHKLGLRFSW